MTANKTGLTTGGFAARFNELTQQEKWFEIQEEFFADYFNSAEGKTPVRKKVWNGETGGAICRVLTT